MRKRDKIRAFLRVKEIVSLKLGLNCLELVLTLIYGVVISIRNDIINLGYEKPIVLIGEHVNNRIGRLTDQFWANCAKPNPREVKRNVQN